MRLLIISLLLSLTVTGCYLGSTLDTPVRIVIKSDFTVQDQSSISDPQYVSYKTMDEYKQLYMNALRSDLTGSNVTIVDEGEETDYTLVISWVKLDESRNTHTVEDADSEFNGQQYELTECEIDADATLYKGNSDNKVGTWIISADKEEKVKNNRNLGDLITGANKDNNTYREKMLDDDVFADLATKCGNRTGAKVTSKIERTTRKGK